MEQLVLPDLLVLPVLQYTMLKRLKPFLIWLAMGTADIIPWVSGGTIAFISWIYDHLIESIAHINKHFTKLIFQAKRKKAWHYIHGNFLVKVFFGILVAIVSIAKLMSFLLTTYPLFIFAFFFGLIIASIWFIWRQHHERFHIRTLIGIIMGIGIGYLLTSNTSLHMGNTSLFSIFFAGMFASIAMILPWISGSYILLLLGKYQYILGLITSQIDTVKEAIHSWQLFSMFNEITWKIFIFLWWVIFWLLWFSKLLHRLLKHHKNTTIAVLIGFMIGAIHTVFPRTNVQIFASMQGVWSIVCTLIGIGVILGIARVNKI